MGIDDTDLLAYVDGGLSQTREAEVEAAVATSPDLAGRLSAMRASALPYASAFEAQVLPPLPQTLGHLVIELLSAHAQPERRRGASWPRLAAAFAAGALCCATALKLVPSSAPTSADARISPWIKAVADYQQLYSRATLANVAEDSALSTRVLADLRVNDGLAVVVPNLRSAALTFKRVQRLSFHDRPVVQMVYLPEQGEPIALCVTPDVRPDETPHAQRIGELNSVAWRQDNLGYVLLGRGPSQALIDLGRSIASGSISGLYGRSRASSVRQAA